MISKLIIVSDNVKESHYFTDNLLPDTVHISLTASNTKEEFLNKLSEFDLSGITNIGLVFHNIGRAPFVEYSDDELRQIRVNENEYESQLAEKQQAIEISPENAELLYTEPVQLISVSAGFITSGKFFSDGFLSVIHTFSQLTTIDIISCNVMFNAQFNMDGITVRYSTNITGRGGDWILESHAVNVTPIYFTDGVRAYPYGLVDFDPAWTPIDGKYVIDSSNRLLQLMTANNTEANRLLLADKSYIITIPNITITTPTSIGTNPTMSGVPFTGNFDGGGCTITLNNVSPSYGGFFGYINGSTNTYIKNVNIVYTDNTVSMSSLDCGGFCGYNANTAISYCSVTFTNGATITSSTSGSIGSGDNNVSGGFCGYNGGTITNCTLDANGTINIHALYYEYFNNSKGGFCGYNGGTISLCTAIFNNTVNIKNNDNRGYACGGFCGYNSNILCGCIVTFVVSTNIGEYVCNNYSGGFCGYNITNGTITNCAATFKADATIKSYESTIDNANHGCSGGFCGYSSSSGAISDCFATFANFDSVITISTASASASYTLSPTYSGGFCGYINSTLSKCTAIFASNHASGSVTINSNIIVGANDINTYGAICGDANDVSRIQNCAIICMNSVQQYNIFGREQVTSTDNIIIYIYNQGVISDKNTLFDTPPQVANNNLWLTHFIELAFYTPSDTSAQSTLSSNIFKNNTSIINIIRKKALQSLNAYIQSYNYTFTINNIEQYIANTITDLDALYAKFGIHAAQISVTDVIFYNDSSYDNLEPGFYYIPLTTTTITINGTIVAIPSDTLIEPQGSYIKLLKLNTTLDAVAAATSCTARDIDGILVQITGAGAGAGAGTGAGAGECTLIPDTGYMYSISTADQLHCLMTDSTYWSARNTFNVTADIDMTGYTSESIGTTDDSFNGTFNGGNYTITISTIGDTYYGFFGTISDTGIISNVNIIYKSETLIPITGIDCGGFCGYNEGNITNCTVIFNDNAQILYDREVSNSAGGFCGLNAGSIHVCTVIFSANKDIRIASQYCGGFCGLNNNTICGCIATFNGTTIIGDIYNSAGNANNTYKSLYSGGFCGASMTEGVSYITSCTVTFTNTSTIKINALADTAGETSCGGGFCGGLYSSAVKYCTATFANISTNISIYSKTCSGGFCGQFTSYGDESYIIGCTVIFAVTSGTLNITSDEFETSTKGIFGGKVSPGITYCTAIFRINSIAFVGTNSTSNVDMLTNTLFNTRDNDNSANFTKLTNTENSPYTQWLKNFINLLFFSGASSLLNTIFNESINIPSMIKKEALCALMTTHISSSIISLLSPTAAYIDTIKNIFTVTDATSVTFYNNATSYTLSVGVYYIPLTTSSISINGIPINVLNNILLQRFGVIQLYRLYRVNTLQSSCNITGTDGILVQITESTCSLTPVSGTTYEISTPAQLYCLMTNSTYWTSTKIFNVTADIDMTGYISESIGTHATAFTNTFNGGNYTIKINDIHSTYNGFFGVNNGTITNCTVTFKNSIDIRGNDIHSPTGGFCGWNNNTINLCTVNFSNNTIITNAYYNGGFCGQNYSTICGCIANFNGFTYIGYDVVHFDTCYSGGFCGYNLAGSITTCTATFTDDITSTNDVTIISNANDYASAGGFCGWNNSTIMTCIATFAKKTGTININSNITGSDILASGGFCGYNDDSKTITGCTVIFANSVTISSAIAGIANSVTISSAIAGITTSPIKNVGVFCGRINDTTYITYCTAILSTTMLNYFGHITNASNTALLTNTLFNTTLVTGAITSAEFNSTTDSTAPNYITWLVHLINIIFYQSTSSEQTLLLNSIFSTSSSIPAMIKRDALCALITSRNILPISTTISSITSLISNVADATFKLQYTVTPPKPSSPLLDNESNDTVTFYNYQSSYKLPVGFHYIPLTTSSIIINGISINVLYKTSLQMFNSGIIRLIRLSRANTSTCTIYGTDGILVQITSTSTSVPASVPCCGKTVVIYRATSEYKPDPPLTVSNVNLYKHVIRLGMI